MAYSIYRLNVYEKGCELNHESLIVQKNERIRDWERRSSPQRTNNGRRTVTDGGGLGVNFSFFFFQMLLLKADYKLPFLVVQFNLFSLAVKEYFKGTVFHELRICFKVTGTLKTSVKG